MNPLLSLVKILRIHTVQDKPEPVSIPLLQLGFVGGARSSGQLPSVLMVSFLSGAQLCFSATQSDGLGHPSQSFFKKLNFPWG